MRFKSSIALFLVAVNGGTLAPSTVTTIIKTYHRSSWPTAASCRPGCDKETLDGLRRAAREREAALRLRSGGAVDVLGVRGTDVVVGWTTITGKQCYAFTAGSLGWSSPFGACLNDYTACRTACLRSFGGGRTPSTIRYTVGGVVPHGATSVTLTLLDGRTRTYDVEHGSSGFIAHIGALDFRSAIVRAGTEIVGRQQVPASVVRSECAQLAKEPLSAGRCKA